MYNNNNRIPPGRAGQNVASPPGRAGQAAASQLQQLEKLTVSGFNRRGTNRFSTSNILSDVTQRQKQNSFQPQTLSNPLEKRVIGLTREQQIQQHRQIKQQELFIEAAKEKERENEVAKKRQRRSTISKITKPSTVQFTPEQHKFFEDRRRRRNQALNIIHRVFATAKINNQIVEYDPVPADLSAEPELLDPSNPSSYNYWISNISSGLIKRLTGLVVRGIYRKKLTRNCIHAIRIAQRRTLASDHG
jgi:hypothetical protein